MTLLFLVACIKDPPPFETPLGALVPPDYFGVDVEGLTDGDTPLPGAEAGAIRLADPSLSLAGAYDAEAGADASGFAEVAGYGGAVLGVLGPTADGDLDAWVDAAAALIDAVPEVDAWEIWSAPNLDGLDATEAADLACGLAGVVDPALLVSPSPSWDSGAQEDPDGWFDTFLAAGGGDCVGAFAVRIDGAGSPESIPDLVDLTRDQLKDAGYVDRPIWNTGGPLDPGSADSAGFVARWLLLQWPHGMDRAYVHSWGGSDVTLVEANNPTPAGDAMATLGAWVTGLDLSGCVVDGTTWTCTVRDEVTRSLIVWDVSGAGEIGVPEDVNTVRYLDGGSEAAGATVALTDVPLLLDGGTGG